MSWSQAVYTTTGAALLTECLEGRVLSITRAVGAVGTYTEDELAEATALADETLALGLLGITDVDDTGNGPGKKIGVQITNENLEEALELHQVGVYGMLDEDESTEQLILILQDERGVEIPTEDENPDFEIDLYAVMAISNTAQIELSVNADVRVTMTEVNEAIAEHVNDENAHASLFSAHNTDSTAHAALIKSLQNQITDATAKTVVTLSIPSTGWSANDSSDQYPYVNSVACSVATADMLPIIVIDEDSEDAAFNCILRPAAETGDGTVTFYAKVIPSVDIACTATLI